MTFVPYVFTGLGGLPAQGTPVKFEVMKDMVTDSSSTYVYCTYCSVFST